MLYPYLSEKVLPRILSRHDCDSAQSMDDEVLNMHTKKGKERLRETVGKRTRNMRDYSKSLVTSMACCL